MSCNSQKIAKLGKNVTSYTTIFVKILTKI